MLEDEQFWYALATVIKSAADTTVPSPLSTHSPTTSARVCAVRCVCVPPTALAPRITQSALLRHAAYGA